MTLLTLILFGMCFAQCGALRGEDGRGASVNGVLDLIRVADIIVEGAFVGTSHRGTGGYDMNSDHSLKLAISDNYLHNKIKGPHIYVSMPSADKVVDERWIAEMFRAHAGINRGSQTLGGPFFPVYAGWPAPGKESVFLIRYWKGRNAVIGLAYKDRLPEFGDLKKLSLAIKDGNIKRKYTALLELIQPKTSLYFSGIVAQAYFFGRAPDKENTARFIEKCDALEAGAKSRMIDIAIKTTVSFVESSESKDVKEKGYAAIGGLMTRRVAFEDIDPDAFNAFLRDLISRNRASEGVRDLVLGLESQIINQYPASKHKGISESFERLKAKYLAR